jgi:succinyl-diaminopimelate desuccinylase
MNQRVYPECEDILRRIDGLSSEIADVTKDLISFRSVNPPGEESEIGEYVYSYLKSAGFKCTKIETGSKRVNVLASFGDNSGPSILFNGHMDVVPADDLDQWTIDPFKAEVNGDIIVGRGASDMKGALAACLVAARCMADSSVDFKGSIQVQAVADEENGSEFGTRALISKGLVKADVAVVMESSVFNGKIHVRPASRGLHWIEVETNGRAAHGSQPDKGINSVLKMSKILLALEKFRPTYTPHNLLSPPTIASGTMIQGGTRPNVIPSSCKAMLDIRTVPGMSEKRDLDEVKEVIQMLSKEDKELDAKIRTAFWWPPAEIAENHDIVKLAKEATSTVTGEIPTARGAPGSNDSSFINALANIPSLAFGPGDCINGKMHSANEWVSLSLLHSFSKIYTLMATWYCGVNQKV